MADWATSFMVLAQAVPGLDQAVGVFLTQGVLGAVCVLIGIGYVRKDAALQAANEARRKDQETRIQDAREFARILAEHSIATANNTQTLQSLATLIQNSSLVRRGR